METYHLYTGKTVPVVLRDEGDEEIRFMKIEQPCIVTICDNCVKKDSVIGAMEKFEAPSEL